MGEKARSDPKSRCEMIQQSAGDSVMQQGVPVLTAVELAIGNELLETEQVLAEELQSDNPYVRVVLFGLKRQKQVLQ